jgi:hypothetical protein
MTYDRSSQAASVPSWDFGFAYHFTACTVSMLQSLLCQCSLFFTEPLKSKLVLIIVSKNTHFDVSGQGPVAGCCECGDEPSGSCATELVSYNSHVNNDGSLPGNSVSIVSGYGLDDRAIEIRSPAGAKDFSCNLCVQTGSGAHPASCPMGTGAPFPGGKAQPKCDVDHSPPSSAEVKNE